jgi:acyl dehydratase
LYDAFRPGSPKSHEAAGIGEVFQLATTESDPTYGRITDEKIAQHKRKVGVWRRAYLPHNYEVSWDGTRHFAYGVGDDNPLWCDPEYGPATRWGGLIAPPMFVQTMGEDDAPPMSDEERAIARRDPLAGIGSYQAVMEFEWWRPLRLGDRVRARNAFVGVQPKNSQFGGRTVHETIAFLYRNQKDELVAIRRGTWIRAEREAKAKREYQLPEPYTDEQLAEIDAAYEAERRRGSDTLFFEDVEVGQEFQPRVKGPLVTTDMIRWHVGVGMGITPPGSARLSYLVRHKVPRLFTADPLNIPDTVQRLHWDPEWAGSLGLPRPYDYGSLRESWMTLAVCDWTGDDAWLWKFRCQHRRFNFNGDTTWVRGRVVGKDATDYGNEVRIEVSCENQHGAVLSPGEVVVLLPTRDEPVTLPHPVAEDFDEMFRQELLRFSE